MIDKKGLSGERGGIGGCSGSSSVRSVGGSGSGSGLGGLRSPKMVVCGKLSRGSLHCMATLSGWRNSLKWFVRRYHKLLRGLLRKSALKLLS